MALLCIVATISQGKLSIIRASTLLNCSSVGEGDDEQVVVDLTRVPPEIQKIVCVVSIYEGITSIV